jgi:hypothetical protein
MLARSICASINPTGGMVFPAPFFIDFESHDGRATQV